MFAFTKGMQIIITRTISIKPYCNMRNVTKARCSSSFKERNISHNLSVDWPNIGNFPVIGKDPVLYEKM